MELTAGKRTRDEGLLDNGSEVSDSKRHKAMPAVNQAKLICEQERQKIEATYTDLSPLPPPVPNSAYLVSGERVHSQDNASIEFYAACARGDMDKVRSYVESTRPPQSTLQYGLEKASHGFHVEAVRYLMKEQGAKLHTRVFETEDKTGIGQTKNIFLSGNPKLLGLLKELVDNGWHPNQVLGSGQQKVALHYVRCIRDLPILRFLLEHGADPTISLQTHPSPIFQLFPDEAPLLRKSGDILDTAAVEASPRAINLLISHGAKLEYGKPLHCLIQRCPAVGKLGETPGLPVDPARYKVAEYLLGLGEDINGVRDVQVKTRHFFGSQVSESGWRLTLFR